MKVYKQEDMFSKFILNSYKFTKITSWFSQIPHPAEWILWNLHRLRNLSLLSKLRKINVNIYDKKVHAISETGGFNWCYPDTLLLRSNFSSFQHTKNPNFETSDTLLELHLFSTSLIVISTPNFIKFQLKPNVFVENLV